MECLLVITNRRRRSQSTDLRDTDPSSAVRDASTPARPTERREGIDERQQLGNVVAIRRGEDGDQGNAARLGQNVMFQPSLAAKGLVRFSLFPQRSARRDALSTRAGDLLRARRCAGNLSASSRCYKGLVSSSSESQPEHLLRRGISVARPRRRQLVRIQLGDCWVPRTIAERQDVALWHHVLNGKVSPDVESVLKAE